jgi:transcription elongation factor Elf1
MQSAVLYCSDLACGAWYEAHGQSEQIAVATCPHCGASLQMDMSQASSAPEFDVAGEVVLTMVQGPLVKAAH